MLKNFKAGSYVEQGAMGLQVKMKSESDRNRLRKQFKELLEDLDTVTLSSIT